ncbi:MAG: aminopeptidase [Gammaproteobacteria bacterium]|nr:aminopeptidase [Gammaproteobacteria bacterium]MYE99443.1 aminopeptidase [Gammaproteobacteria bacterium]
MAHSLARTAALILAALSLSACDSVAWYLQAAQGHLAIVTSRQDMRELLDDPELAPELAAKLQLVLEAREFAESELMLPAGENYLEFVRLEREHAVWNVFAAPEFSVEPVTWCYPIAGCAAYRGYFDANDANEYAAELVSQGLDVYVGGVDAYSTLGWFDDALLSTVVGRPDHQLAALIFHELAHQVAYVPDDTTLSESFATVVEMEGLRRWLDTRQQSELLIDARSDAERRRQFIDFVIGFRDRFEELYGSEMSEADMRRGKSGLQEQMRAEYQALKAEWGGNAGYDGWFSRPLNNAQLTTVGSYNDLAPQLREILRQVGNDLPAFYERMRELTRMSPERRAEYLDSLEVSDRAGGG